MHVVLKDFCRLSSEVFLGANAAEEVLLDDLTQEVLARIGLTAEHFDKGTKYLTGLCFKSCTHISQLLQLRNVNMFQVVH